MAGLIGIRREDKNIWERRVPLTPFHVEQLFRHYSIQTVLQPFDRRAFSDEEYAKVGARIEEDLNDCPIILAVKEIPPDFLLKDKTYLFFSHTIKGQESNMPMLRRLIKLNCSLIDYESIRNHEGRRKVFFGRFAGLAGMIDAFHVLGKRLEALGYETFFSTIKPAYEYHDLAEVKAAISDLGEKITADQLPDFSHPFVVGFAGYGNVSRGAQEIFDLLPHKEIKPKELPGLQYNNETLFYKVIFKEKDLVRPIDVDVDFSLHDYYCYPKRYYSVFERYLPHITLLVNGIYWDERYPRLVTKSFLQQNADASRLLLIADIGCDINGAIEITEKTTEPDHPAFIYNPKTDTIQDGTGGEGIVNIAVDNLPAELPRDASIEFSNALFPYIYDIVNCDFSKPFKSCDLNNDLKNAVIVYKGQLTPNYDYLKRYL